jgi:hypothetical protein
VSLAEWAGHTLRLRYAQPAGSYFPQTDAGVGWTIDAITVADAETVTMSTAPVVGSAPGQRLAMPAAGRWLVQSRPGMHGQFAEWGAGLGVDVAASTQQLADCLFDWGERQYPQLLGPPSRSACSTASATTRQSPAPSNGSSHGPTSTSI